MKKFSSVHLPAMFVASLLSVACGGPMEESPNVSESQALQEGEQALTTLSAGISLCTNLGNGFYGCTGGASGGTPPYSFSWTGNSYVTIDSVTNGPSSSRIEGTCTVTTIGQPNQVTLTVTDSLGATASAQRNFKCTTIVP